MSENKGKMLKIGQVQKAKSSGKSYIKFGQGNKDGEYPSDNFVNKNLPLTLNPGDAIFMVKVTDEKRAEYNIPAFVTHDVIVESRNSSDI